MFKNPLKYQQGGTTPSQEEQQILAAFIQWLPKRVKEFQGMQPEQIAQALDGMSKTPEGKKQLQQLMAQFQQEMQGDSQAFRQGGKIYDFVCKHAKGGKAGHGCKENGGIVEKHQQENGRGSGKLSTPVSTTPKDSSQVEYNMVVPGTEYVLFTDNNGNDIAWGRDKRHNLYNWHAGSEKMYFDPNQQEEYIPYSRFKQWNTGISGSSRLSEEDAQNLNNLFEYAKNNYYNGLKEKGNNLINGLSGLYNRFIGKRVPDTIEATGRRLKTWTDKNGIQHFVEDANVNGNSTVTTIDINGADITGKQKITTGDGRYRMVNLQPGTPEWIAAMSRNVQQQKEGGKVEKHQQDDKGTGTIGNSRQENLRSAADVRQAMNENPEYNRWSYSVSNSDGTKVQTLGNALTQGSLMTFGRDSVITGYPARRTLGVPEVNNTEPGWPLAIAKWNEMIRSNKTTPYYESDQNALDRERVKLRTPKQEKCGGKVVKAQNGTKSLYQQITADGPETYVDGYGTVREMSESPIITGLRKAYHWINMDRTLSDNAYSQKHGYSKPLTGMPPAVYVSPVAQEINLAKYIGFRTPTQMSAEKNAAYSIKAAAEKQKAIDAATKAGKIYVEPKTPLDWDIDLPMFKSNYDVPDLNNIIKFNWPEFIGRDVLLPASGVVGSAAAGSYMATKKDKNKKSENK